MSSPTPCCIKTELSEMLWEFKMPVAWWAPEGAQTREANAIQGKPLTLPILGQLPKHTSR